MERFDRQHRNATARTESHQSHAKKKAPRLAKHTKVDPLTHFRVRQILFPKSMANIWSEFRFASNLKWTPQPRDNSAPLRPANQDSCTNFQFQFKMTAVGGDASLQHANTNVHGFLKSFCLISIQTKMSGETGPVPLPCMAHKQSCRCTAAIHVARISSLAPQSTLSTRCQENQ